MQVHLGPKLAAMLAFAGQHYSPLWEQPFPDLLHPREDVLRLSETENAQVSNRNIIAAVGRLEFVLNSDDVAIPSSVVFRTSLSARQAQCKQSEA